MARRKVRAVTNGDKVATVYRDAEWNEYVVKLKGKPNADYHTDAKDDAMGTAKKMVGLAGIGSPPAVHRRDAKSALLGYRMNRAEFNDAIRDRQCGPALDRLVDSADFAARLITHATSARAKGTYTPQHVYLTKGIDRMKTRFFRACTVRAVRQSRKRRH